MTRSALGWLLLSALAMSGSSCNNSSPEQPSNESSFVLDEGQASALKQPMTSMADPEEAHGQNHGDLEPSLLPGMANLTETSILHPVLPLRVAQTSFFENIPNSDWAACLAEQIVQSAAAAEFGIAEVFDITGPFTSDSQNSMDSKDSKTEKKYISTGGTIFYIASTNNGDSSIFFEANGANPTWKVDKSKAWFALAVGGGTSEINVASTDSMRATALFKVDEGQDRLLDLRPCSEYFK
ncbi:hypothetical protein K2X30_14665 [bacterium]|jgi:hypothetical protein|nr:hypothetical protein [bacterium]